MTYIGKNKGISGIMDGKQPNGNLCRLERRKQIDRGYFEY